LEELFDPDSESEVDELLLQVLQQYEAAIADSAYNIKRN
jgi:hypothetical protein